MESFSPEVPGSGGLPVFLVLEPGSVERRVVSLTILDRLLVTFHRARAGSITVVSMGGRLPEIPRARALGIPFSVLDAVPVQRGKALVAGTSWWGPLDEVERGMRSFGRWTADDGSVLDVGVVDGLDGDWRRKLEALPATRVGPRSMRVADAMDAIEAGRRLWQGLSSSVDGRVDRWFNRPLGRWLFSRWLVGTNVSPNQVSLAATGLGLVAGGLFCVPRKEFAVAAAIVFQASAVVDCVDGDIARAVFKESRLGKWIDLVGDQVVHGAVFAGIATGLARGRLGDPALVLGALAVFGAVASFGAVLRGMRRPGGLDGPLRRIIDGATNRDFSVLVLALACVGRLDWFLWLAAIGGNVFWMVVLHQQRRRLDCGQTGQGRASR